MSPVLLLAPVALAVPVAGPGAVVLIQSGRDPAPLRAAEPVGDSERWLRASDFPAAVFDRSSQLAVLLRVAVDAAGRVTDCAFDPMLDRADPALIVRACTLLRQRGRFRYAIDDAGRPMASTVTFSLWFAPDSDYAGPPPAPPAPPAPGRGRLDRPAPRDPELLTLPADRATYPNDTARVVVDVDKQGRVTRCGLLLSTGSDAGDVALCARLRTARFAPARSPGGKVAYPGMILTLERAR